MHPMIKSIHVSVELLPKPHKTFVFMVRRPRTSQIRCSLQTALHQVAASPIHTEQPSRTIATVARRATMNIARSQSCTRSDRMKSTMQLDLYPMKQVQASQPYASRPHHTTNEAPLDRYRTQSQSQACHNHAANGNVSTKMLQLGPSCTVAGVQARLELHNKQSRQIDQYHKDILRGRKGIMDVLLS